MQTAFDRLRELVKGASWHQEYLSRARTNDVRVVLEELKVAKEEIKLLAENLAYNRHEHHAISAGPQCNVCEDMLAEIHREAERKSRNV
jgi:hypothetical protein